MRLSGITPQSAADGPGLRCVVFAQGCPHRCPNCHNPESWDETAGKEFSVRQLVRFLRKQKKNLRGITFSGGEPFLQSAELAIVAEEVRQMGWDIVTYTGFTYEQLTDRGDADVRALLSACDILIDGRYVHGLRDIGLQFRGSANQRVIDVSESQRNGRVVLWNESFRTVQNAASPK